jgi:ligand-binding sensor domain-containing protein
MKKILIFTTAVFLCFLSRAEDLRFSKLTSKEGLSQSEITTFLKDSKGFMWIGTLDGLNRFDGYNITKFNVNKKDANSLSNNTIRALAEDKYGRIWVGTDDGLNVLYPNNQKFSSIKIPKLNSSFIIIYCLYIDNDHLWIGTDNGLFKAKIDSEDIQNIEESTAIPKENFLLTSQQLLSRVCP